MNTFSTTTRKASASGSLSRKKKEQQTAPPKLNKFRFLCVLDFEAVAERTAQGERWEIIEFPSILLEYVSHQNQIKLEVVDSFQSFVRPKFIPTLNEECKKITGITQEQVDKAPYFDQVLQNHYKWLLSHASDLKQLTRHDVLFITCGNWDLKDMLPKQALMYNRLDLLQDCYQQWCNIKDIFGQHLGVKVTGMTGMLNHLKLKLIGHHHSGIDDCRNITRCLLELHGKHQCNIAPTGAYTMAVGSAGSNATLDTNEITPANIVEESRKRFKLEFYHYNTKEKLLNFTPKQKPFNVAESSKLLLGESSK